MNYSLAKYTIAILFFSTTYCFAQETFSSNTELSICFNASHTYVSDLGFYLIGPQECGSPIIPLAPNPESLNPSNGCCCNSGNNVDSLCFSTSGDSVLSVCDGGWPLSGLYFGYDSVSGPTSIDWSGLYGCPITSGSWRVQIFDCIGADVGTFNDGYLEVTGQIENYNYSVISATSPINDNSCTHETASIIQFGTDPIIITSVRQESLNDIRVNYSAIDNSISFTNLEIAEANLFMFDIAGRNLFESDIKEMQTIQLPSFHGIAIIKLIDLRGRALTTTKLVRP